VSHPPGRWSGWLGPLTLPRRLTAPLLASALRLADALPAWPAWVMLGGLAGILPVVVACVVGWPCDRVLSVVLLAPLLLAAVARDRQWCGLLLLASGFVLHSAAVIFLAARDLPGVSLLAPDGEAYWRQSRDWITTGVSQEYDLAWWLPAHVQLLGGVVLFSYTSLGFLPLWRGLYEVDLMNVYLGQLVAHSDAPGVALLLGWHPWSVCRGVGYLFLIYEVTSLSLARLTGEMLSSPARRRRRWLLGLGFLLLDGLLKYLTLESVRAVLAQHLAS
jgi:hypothetical protein